MNRPDLERELRDELAAALATALETMAGRRPEVAWRTLSGPPEAGGLWWKQPFPPLSGAAWIYVPERDWKAAGSHVLAGAGIHNASEEELRPAFLEVLGQGVAALAQALAAAWGREVAPEGGAEEVNRPPVEAWAGLELGLPDGPITVRLAFDESLLAPLLAAAGSEAAAVPEGPGEVEADAVERAAKPGSRTFELLLDVELPVSVSFGRAHVPLKDVLKLTTGSIIELDRAVNEPVEVVVNNRVIARGEVVVVDGNFGVRIQKVASRHERLRTLD